MHSYKDYQFTIVINDILPTVGRKKKYAAKLQTLLNVRTKQWITRNGEGSPVGESRADTKQEAEAKLIEKIQKWVDTQA